MNTTKDDNRALAPVDGSDRSCVCGAKDSPTRYTDAMCWSCGREFPENNQMDTIHHWLNRPKVYNPLTEEWQERPSGGSCYRYKRGEDGVLLKLDAFECDRTDVELKVFGGVHHIYHLESGDLSQWSQDICQHAHCSHEIVLDGRPSLEAPPRSTSTTRFAFLEALQTSICRGLSLLVTWLRGVIGISQNAQAEHRRPKVKAQSTGEKRKRSG